MGSAGLSSRQNRSQSISIKTVDHSARSNRRTKRSISRGQTMKRLAAFSGVCALTTCASGQLVYEPFNYGSAAQNTFLANSATTTFAGFTNPSNGLQWFDTFTSATTPAADVTITPGNLGATAGLASPNGDSAGITGNTLSAYTARLAINPVPNDSSAVNAGLTSGTMYYSLQFKVNDITGLPAGGTFFAGFNNTSSTQTANPTVVGSQLGVASLSASTFKMQLRQNNTGTVNDASTVLNVGDEVFAVVSYTFVNGPNGTDDVAKLWLNPGSATFGYATPPPTPTLTTSGKDISSLTSLILREGNAAIPKVLSIDEIRIDPSSAQVTMPAGNSWIGANGSSWSTNTNWSTGASQRGIGFGELHGRWRKRGRRFATDRRVPQYSKRRRLHPLRRDADV